VVWFERAAVLSSGSSDGWSDTGTAKIAELSVFQERLDPMRRFG